MARATLAGITRVLSFPPGVNVCNKPLDSGLRRNDGEGKGGVAPAGCRRKRHSGESRNPCLYGYGRQSRVWNERLRKAGREAGRIARLILAGTTRVLSFPFGGNV